MPDGGLLTPGLDLAPGSPAAVTDDVAVLRAMLAVEAAWVRAQARCGVVGPEVATVVERAAVGLAAHDDDAAALVVALARDAAGGGNPVIPLVARLRAAVEAGAGAVLGAGAGLGPGQSVSDVVAAVHTGLTSQDVLDTALVLVLRDSARSTGAGLGRAAGDLAALATRHRDTPALAHTLTQPARPTTFGARAASWLQAVGEARERLADVAATLPVAFGGPAGTLAGTEPGTMHAGLVETWAAELGLPVTAGPWHVTRFPMLRAASALAEVCAALGTVAADVLVGARAEVGELREPAAPGRGGSSSMAHKRNPVLSVLLRRSALAAPPLLAQVAGAAGQAVDERPDGAWHAEWPALQQLARHAVGSAHTAAELLAGLEVDTDALARNLDTHLGTGTGSDGDRDTGLAGELVDRVLVRYAGGAGRGAEREGSDA